MNLKKITMDMSKDTSHTAHTSASASAKLPLSEVRVIEFCQIAAGPFCGMLLADLGADVIKVEPPNGDAMRQWPPLRGGFSENFASVNRNKRSIALNLKDDRDVKIALQLVENADVVIENNRPGAMKRLGLDYHSVSSINSGIVYCSISAFGQTGPRSQEGAFDVTMQAMSGIMSVTGEEDQPPVKCGVPISDFGTGLYAAFHISSALHLRQMTGEGTYIDASMLGASLGIAPLQVSEYFGYGKNPQRIGSRHPRNAPYQAYRASDDYFVIAAGNQRLFEIVCDLLDMKELTDDSRFSDTEKRARNQQALAEILESHFAIKPANWWLEKFRNAGVPAAAINRYSEALADPQVIDQGWVQPLELPNLETTRTFIHPIRLNGKSPPIRKRPPQLDEHREDILAELTVNRSATV